MFTVYLVDDDPRVLKALSRFLGAKGYDVQTSMSAERFLECHNPSLPGCAIFDLSMPGLDGLKLQQVLIRNDVQRPVIFLTGRGNIPSTVRAMKAGAVDFLTKPARKRDLLQAIVRAEASDTQFRQAKTELAEVRTRIETLTPREREVLTHVVAGKPNKQIAYELGTAERTVKFHRGRMMPKLGVRTVADLVRFAEKAGIKNAKC